MGRNKEFDTTEVLHKAMEVFGHYGYEGTTLPELLKGLGIARQSLYDTYGTKRDLFILALKHYVNEKSNAAMKYLETSESAKQGIAYVFHEAAKVLMDKDRQKECFIIFSAIDQMPHDMEIRAFLLKDLNTLEEAFYTALVRGQENGEIQSDRDPRALARYLNFARYSLTQLAKMTSDSNVMDDYVTVSLSTLD
ncbi:MULTISPECIES: TetR/AcrR family transcriptional regulator [unclassified Paenibacillus]|uniref:TetR/AcrR family transcriptional regulator n=1 Tax=unclassified Paenibacillus TaxID=185978 RepID=UPI001F2C8F71|nr:TetR/AcrR family transcriptional regulator [Paenibacillus sp. MZ03-122A]MCF2717079.1 TetR/AcrR family transcriptional regulator [Paenibacillus sp. UKAQ_18]MCP3779266.1 TetR/AcrR family transcriptional regulator [Paenibacillus sp. MZ03-122A]